jgi:hypothetical protein
MNWYFIFYLFSLVPKILTVFGVLAIVTSFVLALVSVSLFFSNDWEDEDWRDWRRWFFWFLPLSFISLTLWTITPDREDMVLIVTGGSIGAYVESDTNLREIPYELTQFLRDEIHELNVDKPEPVKEVEPVSDLERGKLNTPDTERAELEKAVYDEVVEQAGKSFEAEKGELANIVERQVARVLAEREAERTKGK